MRWTILLVALGAGSLLGAPDSCVGSVAVTTFRLTAAAATGSSWVPVRQLNNIPAGYRIRYYPVDLPADLKKDAKLTLVLAPRAADGQITVLEPRIAASPTDWQVPFAPGVVLLVFAPQGLDEKRLTNLVTRDDSLVAALGDYADQTADLEATLDALSDLQDQEDETRAAKPASPGEQALITLVRALNPAASSYDPLGAGRRTASATMMGRGASMFFENAGGIVPGGGILPEVKNWLLPDTEFRSVFDVPRAEDMTLCARIAPRTRNKVAYMWAYRLSNSAPPRASLPEAADAPIGMRYTVPVKLEKNADWRLLYRVFDWALVGEDGTSHKISIRPVPDENGLRLDLRNFSGSAGTYRIEGKWDWSTMRINGLVRLNKLDDLKSVTVAPESQSLLVTDSGPVNVELRGANFRFVQKAWLHRVGSLREIEALLPPKPSGPPDQLSVEIDTDSLKPGQYLLALSRIDSATAEIPVQVLPPFPKPELTGRVNLGEAEQTVTFTGNELDRIDSLESDRAEITLRPSANPLRREALVKLKSGVQVRDQIDVVAKIGNARVRVPGALQVLDARPKILEAKASLPRELSVEIRDGEIPAGSWISFALRAEPATAHPLATIQCSDPALTIQPLRITPTAAGSGAWFVSFDPGSVGQSGCSLTATIETDDLGKSDPVSLGKVVRLPRIENFALTNEPTGNGFIGTLRGFDLETIEQTGWDGRSGLAPLELPRPIPGEGAKQSLRVAMPWPSPTPKAPLYIWLRGETEGRATKITP